MKTYELAFPNRTHGIDVHGIKRRHHDDYLAVQRESGCPVYLAVLEISTGDLLVARLDALRQYACLCPGCRRGEQRRECEVYFNRADFSRRHRFAAAELVELRAVFAKHRPSRQLHHPKPGSAA